MASIVSNTIVASVGRLISLVIGIVIIAVVTRALSPVGYGHYALLLAYAGLLQVVADFGLYLTLTREISAHPEREHYYIAHSLSLRLVLFAGTFLVGAAAGYFLPALRPLLLPFAVITIGFAFQAVSQLFMGIYQKYGTMWLATVGDLIGRLIQLAVVVVGWWWIVRPGRAEGEMLSGGLLIMVTAFTAGVGVTLAWNRWWLPIKTGVRLAFSWPAWRRLLRLSWPLAAMLVLNVIYFRTDIIILSVWRSPTEVGLYGLAYKIVESALFFPAMFGGLLLPRLSHNLAAGRREQASHLLTEGINFLAVAAVGAVVFVHQAAGLLVRLISGPDFSGATPLLEILSVALFVMFFGNLFGFSLVAGQRQRQLLALYAALAAANLLGNLLFIPRFGAMAAAWTTVITEAVATSGAAVLVWRLVRFRLDWWLLVRIGVAGLGVVIVLTVLPRHWPLINRLVAAGVFYIGTSIASGVVSRRDLHLLFAAQE